MEERREEPLTAKAATGFRFAWIPDTSLAGSVVSIISTYSGSLSISIGTLDSL